MVERAARFLGVGIDARSVREHEIFAVICPCLLRYELRGGLTALFGNGGIVEFAVEAAVHIGTAGRTDLSPADGPADREGFLAGMADSHNNV